MLFCFYCKMADAINFHSTEKVKMFYIILKQGYKYKYLSLLLPNVIIAENVCTKFQVVYI